MGNSNAVFFLACSQATSIDTAVLSMLPLMSRTVREPDGIHVVVAAGGEVPSPSALSSKSQKKFADDGRKLVILTGYQTLKALFHQPIRQHVTSGRDCALSPVA